MSDSLKQRGDALENKFFRERDLALIKKIKADMEAKDACEALTSIIGNMDEGVIKQLVSVGISAESLASASMIPLVAVAWADNKMETKERDAILKAADGAGIDEGSAAHTLLSSWLKEQPEDDVLETWKLYIAALKDNLEGAAYSQLKIKILERARGIAQAAGGFLGMGTISPAEERVLGELEDAF